MVSQSKLGIGVFVGLGAAIGVTAVVLILFFLFLQLDIISLKEIQVLDVAKLSSEAQGTSNITHDDLKVIEKLHANGLIYSSSDLLSHLLSYYNSLIAFLGIFIAGIGLVTVWLTNLKVKHDLEEFVKSNPDIIVNWVKGDIEDLVRKDFEQFRNEIRFSTMTSGEVVSDGE